MGGSPCSLLAPGPLLAPGHAERSRQHPLLCLPMDICLGCSQSQHHQLQCMLQAQSPAEHEPVSRLGVLWPWWVHKD